MVTTLVVHRPPVKIRRPRNEKSTPFPQSDISLPARTQTAFVPVTGPVEQPGTMGADEDRQILVLISIILLSFVLPAVLTLVYLLFNPDAFMLDITPNYDFSYWQYGDPVKPMGSREPPIGQ